MMDAEEKAGIRRSVAKYRANKPFVGSDSYWSMKAERLLDALDAAEARIAERVECSECGDLVRETARYGNAETGENLCKGCATIPTLRHVIDRDTVRIAELEARIDEAQHYYFTLVGDRHRLSLPDTIEHLPEGKIRITCDSKWWENRQTYIGMVGLALTRAEVESRPSCRWVPVGERLPEVGWEGLVITVRGYRAMRMPADNSWCFSEDPTTSGGSPNGGFVLKWLDAPPDEPEEEKQSRPGLTRSSRCNECGAPASGHDPGCSRGSGVAYEPEEKYDEKEV